MEANSPRQLRARWVFPMDGGAIEDGVIEITDGRIMGLSRGRDRSVADLGEVAIIPGLVNAHTHLEFSHLQQPLAPAVPFADWVRTIVAARLRDASAIREAAAAGLDELQRHGTTVVGEIVTSPVACAELGASAIRSVAFWEVLGLDEAAVERQQAAVNVHLQTSAASVGSTSVRGLSPHAPYSIRPDLFLWTIERAAEAGVPVAMHLAETREELELLAHGSGPLVELLREFGVWSDGVIPRGRDIRWYLEELSRLERVLVVHGNYLTPQDMDFIADRPQFSVVFCPRTHTYFAHEPHPWRAMLDRGINVALGTDSRASNPDLSLWQELLHLRRTAPDLPGETLLAMATWRGAHALGLSPGSGTLAVGSRADLAIIELGGDASLPPFERLFHPQSRVAGRMWQGNWSLDDRPV